MRFQASLGFIANFRSVWATLLIPGQPDSKQQKSEIDTAKQKRETQDWSRQSQVGFHFCEGSCYLSVICPTGM